VQSPEECVGRGTLFNENTSARRRRRPGNPDQRRGKLRQKTSAKRFPGRREG